MRACLESCSLVALATLLFGTGTFAQNQTGPIDLKVGYTPVTVTIGHVPMVYYELHLENGTRDTVTLETLEVVQLCDSTVLFSISDKNLDGRLAVGSRPGKTRGSVLPIDGKQTVYLEYGVPPVRELEIGHRITFSSGDGISMAFGAVLQLPDERAISLGPPLKGGPWAAVYDPEWERGHRRVFYDVEGQRRIPGRFAIDFIKLDAKGRTALGDRNEVDNWYGYGAEVLAVADGTVVSTRTDFMDSATLGDHPSYGANEATGNYISMDIGNGHFAFYEHLKSGSIQVEPGQRVKKGEVIASLGFTGQSTGPHLHFHLADADSPLGAEGVPFGFESFVPLGGYPDFDTFGEGPWSVADEGGGSQVTKERPAPNTVVRFQ